MSNLSNCMTCGTREHWSDLHLIGGRYICDHCNESIPEWVCGYDAVFAYVQSLPLAEPLNIHGTGPLDPALR